jgi:hypothetical protein
MLKLARMILNDIETELSSLKKEVHGQTDKEAIVADGSL